MPNKNEYAILIFNQYFGTQLSWIYAGIESTMKKESSHSCALLLSTYTEVLGGLVTGNLRERGEERKNFEAFLPYLGDYYVELHKKIDLYSTVRSKFVHEFSLRPSYVIWVNEKTTDRKGIESMNNHLNFHIREYYRDFKKGIENYKKDLVNSNELFARFIHALAIR
jgi:hypothetical protein